MPFRTVRPPPLCVHPSLAPLHIIALFVGRRLVEVWIGDVWNGHFPKAEKHFSEAEISRKIPEIP